MSYMHGRYYIWRGAKLFIETDEASVGVPISVMDEFVVMRYAQMTPKERELAEKRAIHKHQGNISCDPLCKKHGKETVQDVVDREVKKAKKKRSKKILTNDKYILKGKKVVECHDLLEWGKWFETADRIVKQDTLKNGLWVSTVFLGLDHNFFGKGKPILFETMVFAPAKKEKLLEKEMMIRKELDQNRYCTWKEAEKGHKKMVKKWKAK